MIFEVRIPEIGESIRDGVIDAWLVSESDIVRVDDPLLELETDKVNMTIAADEAGRVALKATEGDKVDVGQVVATIDTDAAGEAPAAPAQTEEAPEVTGPVDPPAGIEQARAKLSADAPLSPAARRYALENAIEPADIEGSGKGGLILKEDLILAQEAPAAPEPVAPVAKKPPVVSSDERQTRKPMTPLRARVAERLVHAQQTAAILTSFNEADMSAVIQTRTRLQEVFKEKHGVKLGFMSFFVKAVVDALQAFPVFNSQIDGDVVVTNHFYDIGIAVGTERGLVVPVLRDADQMSFGDIERQIVDYAKRAADKRLELSELAGGCFTITNGGVYGSLLSTPILNPPQSGILGMHTIKKRPVVVDDEIVIRPMMNLAVSYDHRLIDGRDAVLFLNHIIECVEAPERLMMVD